MLIPYGAKICPYCKSKLGWSLPAKIFFSVICFLIIGSVLNRFFVNHDTANENPTTIIISSENLYNEYKNNEIAADERFKGKKLLVTGIVREIGTGIGNTYYVILSSGQFSQQVMATFDDSSKNRLAKLKKGDSMDVMGMCTGMTLGSVVVRCY